MANDTPSLGTKWWLIVLLGAGCLVIGVLALVWPDKTLLTIGLLTGIYLIFAAIMELLDAIAGPPHGRAFSAIVGVLALIAGLICLRRPGESLIALILVLGAFLIAEGVFGLVRAFAEDGGGWAGALRPAFDVLAGIVILAWPKLGLGTLAILFGIVMLVRGAFTIYLGVKLRELHRSPGSSPAAYA
jgi:uncharacterized membrane protein HdeD (DUF308 family)